MINWKLRLQNKATLLTLATTAIGLVYSLLACLGIQPGVGQQQAVNLAATAISLLALLGIVNDPTTAGLADSEAALAYPQPKQR